MKNVSDRICRENKNTYFVFNTFFENPAVYEKMWKNMVRPEQATDDNMAHAHIIADS
jgi:hypothetical protein